MKWGIVIFFLALVFSKGYSQVEPLQEQQLESFAEQNADVETEDDSYQQQMEQFRRDPVNMNEVDEILLHELKILSDLQVRQFLVYRRLLGKFLSIYELQAIPGWDLNTIKMLLPYIRVGNINNSTETFSRRVKGGQHILLLRLSQVLEKSLGYSTNPVTGSAPYPGSPQRVLLRYKYAYKNLLQYGITAEKDPGEQFFKGSRKSGFDFYSAHVCFRKLGFIKTMLVGDYTVNMGQGLIQWQTMAFGKGAEVLNVKRQSAVIRPYTSVNEINFHRGIAMTVGKKYWEYSIFVSAKKIDANYQPADSAMPFKRVTSFQTSGYHRQKNEIDDRASLRQSVLGANFSYNRNQLHFGANFINYKFQYPLLKENEPYRLYSLVGNRLTNYSIDYGYSYRNLHIFGELAGSGKKAMAFVSGLLISAAENVDLSILYRNISEKYHSLYSNAFTESGNPSNERGIFAGASIRAPGGFRLDAYVDFFSFPWLKYQVHAPSSGSEAFLKLAFRPGKQLELYVQYRRKLKPGNVTNENLAIYPLENVCTRNLRIHLNYVINPNFIFRSRVETVTSNKEKNPVSNGYLGYMELINSNLIKNLGFNLRVQYFKVDTYDSRVYSFENDVLYGYSIPSFSGERYRYYLNLNYTMSHRMEIWMRIAQTHYRGQDSIGSGSDEIFGNHKSEVKLQVMYKF